MARRSDHTREELYEITLDAAANIIKSDGFRALTARNVADVIGYSAGTLYNLFENIDDLILHLNGRTLDQLSEVLLSQPISGDAEKDVGALVEVYLKFIEQSPALWNLLFDHTLPEGATLPGWYDLKIEKVLARLEEAMSTLFGPDQRAERANAARVLWASLHGISSLGAQGKLMIVSSQTVSEMANSLFRNYLSGLVNKNKQQGGM